MVVILVELVHLDYLDPLLIKAFNQRCVLDKSDCVSGIEQSFLSFEAFPIDVCVPHKDLKVFDADIKKELVNSLRVSNVKLVASDHVSQALIQVTFFSPMFVAAELQDLTVPHSQNIADTYFIPNTHASLLS